MGEATDIQWCDSTVNPTKGCDGCELWNRDRKACYAGNLHEGRLRRRLKGYHLPFESVSTAPGQMEAAARWPSLSGKARYHKPWLDSLPRLIFVSDMSDALSLDITFRYLRSEVIRIAASPHGARHQWLWLTKQPGRLAQLSATLQPLGMSWPENLWVGTSVTSQGTVKNRVTQLLKVGDKRTIRFLSVEPQVETIDVAPFLSRLNWVIQGGESGDDARRFDLEWAEALRDQCARARVPYFLKQLGAVVYRKGRRLNLKDSHGGDWDEWPEDLGRDLRAMPWPRKGGGRKR